MALKFEFSFLMVGEPRDESHRAGGEVHPTAVHPRSARPPKYPMLPQRLSRPSSNCEGGSETRRR